uniref:Uncharacterized protein n=1 Tax=Brugia malayi TaxID=6279 RepID=A8PZ77_BRUMA
MNAHVRLLRKVDQSCHLYQGHAKLKDSGEYKEEHKDGRNHGVEVTQLFLARFIFLKGTRDVPIK